MTVLKTRLLTDPGSALFGMCSDARKHDVHSVLSQMHRRIRDRSPEWGGRVDRVEGELDANVLFDRDRSNLYASRTAEGSFGKFIPRVTGDPQLGEWTRELEDALPEDPGACCCLPLTSVARGFVTCGHGLADTERQCPDAAKVLVVSLRLQCDRLSCLFISCISTPRPDPLPPAGLGCLSPCPHKHQGRRWLVQLMGDQLRWGADLTFLTPGRGAGPDS
ncbi:uncharacterized protein LOC107179252 [Panthera tigris]|uniref:uncharacterized protein LOC107179252 n=1 Tax=Panthera tigris TaxID=9694 RepID=UPI001C6F7D9E|nr:uncharacterized protein LOC107179252 [Panthera tigris]